jgi:hypothetical protein
MTGTMEAVSFFFVGRGWSMGHDNQSDIMPNSA